MLYWNEILKCSSLEFAGFTAVVWLIQLSEYVDIPHWHVKGNLRIFLIICGSYQAKITQVIRSCFHDIWEIPFTFVFTCPFTCYFKIVWPQVCFSFLSTCKVSQKCRRKCHRSIEEKGTVAKAKSLFVGGLKISPKKYFHREIKMPRPFATKIKWAE